MKIRSVEMIGIALVFTSGLALGCSNDGNIQNNSSVSVIVNAPDAAISGKLRLNGVVAPTSFSLASGASGSWGQSTSNGAGYSFFFIMYNNKSCGALSLKVTESEFGKCHHTTQWIPETRFPCSGVTVTQGSSGLVITNSSNKK